jgi:hypothetical protein
MDLEIVLKDLNPIDLLFMPSASLESPIILSVVFSKIFLKSCAKLYAFSISGYNSNNIEARSIWFSDHLDFFLYRR